jgi:hypothetical protein
LWLIAGRSASRTAICRASSFMCATHLSCHISFLDFSNSYLPRISHNINVLGDFQVFL